jgi:hypothetical protein
MIAKQVNAVVVDDHTGEPSAGYVLASDPIEMVEERHGVVQVGQGARQSLRSRSQAWQSRRRKSLWAVEASA